MTTATVTHRQIPTGTWSVDPAHSTIGFVANHLGFAPVRGEFREFEGTIEVGTDLESSRAYGTVSAGSVTTNQQKRDKHLRSVDFFDATNHPELRFESTRIEAIADQTIRIVGELEIRGVTCEIGLEFDLAGVDDRRVNLHARATLSRRDYGMDIAAVRQEG